MKGSMASGQLSRGKRKENVRAEGGIVMAGNFDVDVERQRIPSPQPTERELFDGRKSTLSFQDFFVGILGDVLLCCLGFPRSS
jgi:hypothetical protein